MLNPSVQGRDTWSQSQGAPSALHHLHKTVLRQHYPIEM